MMVAAHPHDLAAARAVGFRTAFIDRTLEHGAARVAAADFEDLADQLGA
ncbi:MAG: haloacid dehalogenase type II, partial [Chloroflexi bacterium]|nr:haloacid dehalogenase type II [Chloroflexota bacterium]